MVDLIVFLGNPGADYRSTRHNVGRMVAEALPDAGTRTWKEKFHGRIAEYGSPGRRTRLLIPETFMNESGRSVAAAAAFYRVEPEGILVVHDDLELPFGRVSQRLGGGLAGHNGLRSIKDHLKTADFGRLRVGIGRPDRGSVRSWVLSRFSPEDEAALPEILESAAARIDAILAGRTSPEDA